MFRSRLLRQNQIYLGLIRAYFNAVLAYTDIVNGHLLRIQGILFLFLVFRLQLVIEIFFHP